jgi:hypothetical protein
MNIAALAAVIGSVTTWMPMTWPASPVATIPDTPAPMSPPCTPYRSYPSRRASSAHARAIRLIAQPGPDRGVEKPYPGIDGTTTWNAGPSTGSVSRPMSRRNSTNELG